MPQIWRGKAFAFLNYCNIDGKRLDDNFLLKQLIRYSAQIRPENYSFKQLGVLDPSHTDCHSQQFSIAKFI